MNISTLTVVLHSGLLLTSGSTFAAPDGAVDANAGANVSVSTDEAADRDRDERAAGAGTVDGERGGLVGRLGGAVSAAVGGGEVQTNGERSADSVEVETNGHASVDENDRSDDGSDASERAAQRVRSTHDRVRPFRSGSFGGDIGVRVGLEVFATS